MPRLRSRTASLLPAVTALAALTGVGVLAPSAAVAEPTPRSWVWNFPKTDFDTRSVTFAEIQSGGPQRDGIPPIDAPIFADVEDRRGALPENAPVMSVEIDGDARAYPLEILLWHEIVNDVVGGVPIAVTYCPLCNSGVVFDRRVDGRETSFGTTGKLRNSDLIMYDRATESWWQQYEGVAIIGAQLGAELTRLPVRQESFATFAARHPNGRVLIPNDKDLRQYGRNPYVRYDTKDRPFFYRGDYTGPGSPIMRVVHVHGREEAWSVELIREAGEIVAPDPKGDLVLRWRPGKASPLDAADVASGRDVGIASVARRTPDGLVENVVFDVPFAFAFNAFHPAAPIHHVQDPTPPPQ